MSLPMNFLMGHEPILSNFNQARLLVSEARNVEALSLLQNKPEYCRYIDETGSTLLHYAAKNFNPEMVEYLIQNGCPLDVSNSESLTALFCAFETGRLETVKLLVHANANINVRDKNGRTMFQSPKLSTSLAYMSIKEVLLKSLQAKCNFDSDALAKLLHEMNCPLRVAVGLREASVTERLIDYGAPVNQADPNSNKTALHVAALNLDYENVRLLLDRGASVNLVDRNVTTALGCVGMRPNERDKVMKVLELLLERGAAPLVSDDWQIFDLLMEGDREVIRYILNFTQIDFTVHDSAESTPLHILACNVHPNIMDELKDIPLDINARSSNDDGTALHYAIKNPSSVEFLLNRGADINARDRDGYTALMRCTLQTNPLDNDQQEVLKSIGILLRRGADVRIESNEGETILDLISILDRQAYSEPILAHMAFVESMGFGVMTENLHQQTYSIHKFRNFFESCCDLLAKMKRVLLQGSITLYDLAFHTDFHEVEIYFRHHPEVALPLKRLRNRVQCNDYYMKMLITRLDYPLRVARLRLSSIVVFCKIFQLNYESHHIIVEHTFAYLDTPSMRNLCFAWRW